MEKNNNDTSETIDFPKLRAIFLKNRPWVLALFLICNLVAYLFIRYTKNVYEAEAEIKLELKNEANEFGITKIIEDQNLNLLSGEIELIQSSLFLSRVIDSLDLHVSYYSVGDFLNYELYKNSPFVVTPVKVPSSQYDVSHTIKELSNFRYEIVLHDETVLTGEFGKPISANGVTLLVQKSKGFNFEPQNNYSFVLNSARALRTYFLEGLQVEPKNFNANTIRIAFKEFHGEKAMDVVNRIVSVYRNFSYDQKSFANTQKIGWVNHELEQIEEKMEQFEDYFKDFTLENKTQNLNEDLARTVLEMNSIDTVRYQLRERLKLIGDLKRDLTSGKTERPISLSDKTILPEEVVAEILAYQKKLNELNTLKLSYKESSFAFKQIQNDVDFIVNRLTFQLGELESITKIQLKYFDQRRNRLETEFANMPDKTTEYTKNQRFYKLYEEFYFTLMKSRSEFEIAQAGTIPDFKILSAATLPSTPISPNRLLITAAGFTTSLVVIFFFIGFLYLIDDKITSVHELERIAKVSILGIIPSFRNSRKDGLPVQSGG